MDQDKPQLVINLCKNTSAASSTQCSEADFAALVAKFNAALPAGSGKSFGQVPADSHQIEIVESYTEQPTIPDSTVLKYNGGAISFAVDSSSAADRIIATIQWNSGYQNNADKFSTTLGKDILNNLDGKTTFMLNIISSTPVEISYADIYALQSMFEGKITAEAGITMFSDLSMGSSVSAVDEYTIDPIEPEHPHDYNIPYGTNMVVIDANANPVAISIDGYQPTAAAFTLSTDVLADLAGKNVVFNISNTNPDSPGTVSLTKIHEMYQAIKAGSPASISMSSDLAPLYKGSEWIKKGIGISDPVITLYESYAGGETLLPGVSINKIGSQYVLEYSGNLVVEDIVYHSRPDGKVYGAGIKKVGGSAAPVPSGGDWANVIIASDERTEYVRSTGSANNVIEYFQHLGEAGLMYSGGSTPSPVHKMVVGSVVGDSDLNMFSNGLYDFLNHHKDGNKMDRISSTSFMGDLHINGQVFEDGTFASVARRNANGSYNPAFPGNLPVSMVNFLRDYRGPALEFYNINIIGDGKDMSSLSNLHFANVSLVGYYSDNGTLGMGGYFYGTLDIEGDAPVGIENHTYDPTGYLTIWNASKATAMNNFSVLHVKSNNISEVKRIGSNNLLYQNITPLQAITFEKKNPVINLGTASSYHTNITVPTAYRAVRDPASNTYKFTGSVADGFYSLQASDTSAPVPSIDPEVWRAAGNSKSDPAETTWGALDASKKWTLNGFNAISMLKGAAMRLAEAMHSRFSRSMG